jgi:streptogramin lyase
MKHWLKAAALVPLLLAAPAAAAPGVEEFPLATAGSQPQDLVLGPDGNIWFAERGNNKIGRISASAPGTIDESLRSGPRPASSPWVPTVHSGSRS